MVALTGKSSDKSAVDVGAEAQQTHIVDMVHPPLALGELVKWADNVITVLVVRACIALNADYIENMSSEVGWGHDQR